MGVSVVRFSSLPFRSTPLEGLRGLIWIEVDKADRAEPLAWPYLNFLWFCLCVVAELFLTAQPGREWRGLRGECCEKLWYYHDITTSLSILSIPKALPIPICLYLFMFPKSPAWNPIWHLTSILGLFSSSIRTRVTFRINVKMFIRLEDSTQAFPFLEVSYVIESEAR